MLRIIGKIFVFSLIATYLFLVVALPVYYIVKKFYKKNKDLPSKEIVSNFYAYGLIPLLILTLSFGCTDLYLYYHYREASVLSNTLWEKEIFPQIPYNAMPMEWNLFRIITKVGAFGMETECETDIVFPSIFHKTDTTILLKGNDTTAINLSTMVGYAFNKNDLLLHLSSSDKKYYWVQVVKTDPYCEELTKKEYQQYLIDNDDISPQYEDIHHCDFQLQIIDIDTITKRDYHWVFMYHKLIGARYYVNVIRIHQLLVTTNYYENGGLLGLEFLPVSLISTLFGMLPITIYLCRKKKKEQEIEE